MRILMTLFEIQDYGGIVGDVEFLYRGLTEEGGHDVDFVILRPNDQDPYTRKSDGPVGSYPSYVGTEVNTQSGWYGVPVRSYGSAKRIREWKAFANGYDLVIHEIAVPKPDKDGLWKKIYDLKTTQIVITHDAHFREMYPHFALVAHKIAGMSVTNHAGFVATSWCPHVPRAFVGAPHELQNWKKQRKWRSRYKQAVSAHVWKPWKHMDAVVRAVPYVFCGQMVLAGDGIEGRYMRSKKKCKPKYEGIWQAALKAGMDYRGLISYRELFELYGRSRVMVDMSYSKKYAQLGNHFNRATIEAYNTGCVPLVVDVNMEDAEPAQVQLFHHGKTHRAVTREEARDPNALGIAIDKTLMLSEVEAGRIVAAGRRILSDHFDYRKNWREFLKLADGGPAGIYPKMEVGSPPKGFMKFAKRFAEENAR